MRPLTPTPRQQNDRDQGAVLVWVALMLTVLIGVGAIVVDAGALYTERRQLQNGADAGALAVARDLAEGTAIDEYSMAATYADANANDGASNVDEVCGSGPGLDPCPTPPAGAEGVSGYVQVTTSTADADGGDQVPFLLAPILDATNVGKKVHASAVAAWGPIGRATTFPFTFSLCELNAFGGSIDPFDLPSEPSYIYSHKTPTETHDCVLNPSSGLRVPGGFGWLDSTDCEATITAGDPLVGSDPGNDVPNGCDPTEWQNAEVLVPVYDDCARKADGNCISGGGAEYSIVGFVGFKILGYRVGNTEWNMPGDGKCPDTEGNSGRCFYGEFTEGTFEGEFDPDSPDYGARSVSMIG
jgi:hypothetical protein